MKSIFLFLCFVLVTKTYANPTDPPYIRIGGTFDTNTNQVVGGTTYTNQQTVWIECGTSSIVVSVPVIPSYTAYWGSSSTFTKSSVGGVSFFQTVQLDPNKNDGFISVAYSDGGPIGSNAVIINIKQLPSIPTISGTNVCAGNSATFTASSTYPFQSTKPMSMLWQTTGGVTVNGVSSVTSAPNINSSVTIANSSSSGTYSVRAVVPTCSNMQTSPTTGNLGTAIIKNPTYWLFDSGSNMWQFSQSVGGPGPVTYTFYVASGSATLNQNNGDCYITTLTGANVCVYGTNPCGVGIDVVPFWFTLLRVSNY